MKGLRPVGISTPSDGAPVRARVAVPKGSLQEMQSRRPVPMHNGAKVGCIRPGPPPSAIPGIPLNRGAWPVAADGPRWWIEVWKWKWKWNEDEFRGQVARLEERLHTMQKEYRRLRKLRMEGGYARDHLLADMKKRLECKVRIWRAARDARLLGWVLGSGAWPDGLGRSDVSPTLPLRGALRGW